MCDEMTICRFKSPTWYKMEKINVAVQLCEWFIGTDLYEN